MANLADKIEQLPPELKAKAEGYIDALVDVVIAERTRFMGEIDAGLADIEADRVIADATLKAELEAKYGKLRI